MGLHVTFDVPTQPDSFPTFMVPMFLFPGLAQVAAGAFVLWEYSPVSVRPLSVVLGLWVWLLVGLAIEQTGVWTTSPPNIAWQNVAAAVPVVAGIFAFKLSCRILSPVRLDAPYITG